jgi:hypothetical protein
MATRRYGTSRGESQQQITEAVGAAVSSDNMEFTVDLAVSLSKEDVLLGLEKIKGHIINGNWPPA